MLLQAFMSSGDEDDTPRPMTAADIRRWNSWFFWEKPMDEAEGGAVGGDDTTQADIEAAWGSAYSTLLNETKGLPH